MEEEDSDDDDESDDNGGGDAHSDEDLYIIGAVCL